MTKKRKLEQIDTGNQSDRDGQKQEILASGWVSGKLNPWEEVSYETNLKPVGLFVDLPKNIEISVDI